MLYFEGQNPGTDGCWGTDPEVGTEKVSANMVSLQFGDMPETTVQDGTVLIPVAEMRVTSSFSELGQAKGLVPMTLPSGEVMWVHQDLGADMQQPSSRSK